MNRNDTLSGLVLLVLAMQSTDTIAQSIDDCMNAGQDKAVSLCRTILENGSRNADVYWKLASALYQNGKQASANKILGDALSLHPGNAKLVKLQDIISSEKTEQSMLEQAAELNQKSFDQGALKISCLTQSGIEGISACKRRLELTDSDGDNMRARLAELENHQSSAIIGTGNNPATISTDPVKPENPDQQAAKERQITYKKLITKVQTNLNELGFPTGTPDGFPGNKTRTALNNFYAVLDAPASQIITDSTLVDLITQKHKLDVAKQFLKDSKDALLQGNIASADKNLASAKASSKLLKVPDRFEEKLRLSKNNIGYTDARPFD